MFAMGRVMTKAQVVAASWLRDSSLSVVARPPSRIFCQQGRHLLQSGPIAPFSDKSTCRSIRMTFDPHDVRVVRPSIHASLGPYGFLATCRSE